MELTQLQYAVSERMAVLTINRPERMNAWTPTLEQELRHAIE
nr:enoyl-CoA hydratase [Pseudomonas sp.]